MFNWFKKYSVSILDRDWKPIKEVVKVKHVPRTGELIYFEEGGTYYRIIHVVHYLNKKQGIFIIVEKLKQAPNE